MSRIFLQLIIISIFIFFSSMVQAIGIGARASSLGFGVELSQPLAKKVSTRFGLNGFTYSFERTESEIDYDVDLSLNTLSAIIDWHPTGGRFRVSGGIFINGNQFDISSNPQGQYDIGDDVYTGSFDVDGEFTYLPVAPYFGIGWGVNPNKKNGWNMTAELGIVFQGAPNVSLNASGTATRNGDNFPIDVSQDAIFIENLAIEEANLQNDVDGYALHPVLSIGFIYSF